MSVNGLPPHWMTAIGKTVQLLKRFVHCSPRTRYTIIIKWARETVSVISSSQIALNISQQWVEHFQYMSRLKSLGHLEWNFKIFKSPIFAMSRGGQWAATNGADRKFPAAVRAYNIDSFSLEAHTFLVVIHTVSPITKKCKFQHKHWQHGPLTQTNTCMRCALDERTVAPSYLEDGKIVGLFFWKCLKIAILVAVEKNVPLSHYCFDWLNLLSLWILLAISI